MIVTGKSLIGLVIAGLFITLINAGLRDIAQGLILFSWTPVWAAYALWKWALDREKIRMPNPDKFEEEYRTLLEKEGNR